MFEQLFKNIDNILHTDSGCGTELDYVEQTSWILFLKYLDDLEETKKTEAALAGKKYEYKIGEIFSELKNKIAGKFLIISDRLLQNHVFKNN